MTARDTGAATAGAPGTAGTRDASAIGPPAAAAPPVAQRSIALDALRGLAIAGMILANNPGRWGAEWQYPPLRHAEWHGCTATDLVFPTFLFCVGAAIVPALQRRLAAGAPRRALVGGIVRRGVLLVLLGLLLHAFPFVGSAADRDTFAPLLGVRVPGVLQRIGVCYTLAALLFVSTGACTQRAVLLALLLGHWLVSVLVPVPGVGVPDLDTPAATLQGFVDRAVFGAHVWRGGVYDPEGLLSTAPALATVLLGVAAGRVLLAPTDVTARAYGLLRLGALWLAAGAVWGWFLPWNKPLWTGSYAVGTAGIACLLLGLAVWAFEQRSWTRLAHPLRVYGANALLVFFGSGVLARVLTMVDVDGAGGTPHAKDCFFTNVLLGPIGDGRLASLAFGLLWILGWYAVLAALWRRGIVWRV